MSKPRELEYHPFANVFPLMQGEEFEAFAADIREHGQRDLITLYDGRILDGRNRYRACMSAAMTPATEIFSGSKEDALSLVVSRNVKRRNLNDDQRRLVAARLANLTVGRPAKSPQTAGITIASAAAMVNVDAAGTERARTILAVAAHVLVDAVEKGKLTVSSAAQAAKLAPEIQREVARAAMAGESNVVRGAIKKAGRALRETELGRAQLALPSSRYGVILADPEWRFEPRSRATGLDRAADQHYPTSETDTIASRDMPSIAADNSVLFLWATPPMIEDALLVMKAWGFTYKSQCIWNKLRSGNARGTGYWFTGEHELLLLGVRGNVPAPAPGTQWRSVMTASVGEHSEKPEIFYKLIEEYFPTLPKIELNARRARAGWDAWGFESPVEENAA